MWSRKAAQRISNLIFLMILAGCSSPPKQFQIRGDGDSTLNRDAGGKSLSVEIRIYQLKDTKEFSKLTFEALASGRPDNEILGTSLLEKTEMIVIPGGRFESAEKLADETKFIGIAGLFRTPDRHHWRQLISVNAATDRQGRLNREKGVSFRVKDCYIALDDGVSTPLPDQLPNIKPNCDNSPRVPANARSPSTGINSSPTTAPNPPAIGRIERLQRAW